MPRSSNRLSSGFAFCHPPAMKSPLARTLTVDRKAISVVASHENASTVRYWRRQPAAKRLEALELLRQCAHAYDPLTARLRRFLAVTEHKRD
jgi:hypothetical protein